MHVVNIGGVNQLVVVFSVGYVYSYSISDFNVIKMENLVMKCIKNDGVECEDLIFMCLSDIE